MTAIPLGHGAYKRTFTGEPEIRLENRYFEGDPSNLREHGALIARPGTLSLAQFASTGFGRGTFWKPGMFGDDLFVVSGGNFYRYATDGTLLQITGTISGTRTPYVTWQKGIGYERLFIADGTNIQYYNTHAMGTLTLAGGAITNQVFTVNGVYYSWSATVNAGTPAGTIGAPYLALLGSGSPIQAENDALSLANMEKLINNTGTSGFDYSGTLTSANADVTATSTATTLVLTAIADLSTGNLITTTISSGAFVTWTAGTLTGGGNQALQPVTGMLPGEVAKALASVSSYVLVSVGFAQKFYFIQPGEVKIDPLDFASKESNPDPIVDMHTVGDQVLITGSGSTENWYATGDLTFPFAPIEGRVFRRGTIEGTPVVVGDSLMLIGDDGIVYEIGQGGTDAAWGVHRISNSGIEERIRTQMRRLQGLS